MTTRNRSRTLTIAVVALMGVGVTSCSGSDGADQATATSSAAPTETNGASTTVVAPVGTAEAGSSVPTSSGPPATDAVGSSTVPAPVAGGQGAVVPVATVAPQAATPLGAPATDAGGLRFAIDSIEAVEGEASAPGEIGGPALRVTLRTTNTSSSPVDLSLTVVDLRHGADEVPAAPFTIGTSPLSGTLAPGASATGVYVFAVPEQRRDQVTIYVNARPELPSVVFEGSAR